MRWSNLHTAAGRICRVVRIAKTEKTVSRKGAKAQSRKGKRKEVFARLREIAAKPIDRHHRNKPSTPISTKPGGRQ